MPLAPDYKPRRVSVIIITFNYGRFINNAIQSALSQNIDDLEIIVVDDGSTDATYDTIRPYKDRIKYIYQNNSGQSAARNTGLENCTGEFIQFLDSDDILGRRKIRTQLEYFREHPEASIAVCSTKRFSKINKNGMPQVRGSWYLFRDTLDLYLCFCNIAPPHAFLYRRKVILHTGLMDSDVDNCEDYDFLLRAASLGFIPRYTPACVVYYRQHSSSVTANALRQYLTDVKMHIRLAKLLDNYPDFPHDHRLEGLLAYAAGVMMTAARLYPIRPQTSREMLELVDRHMKTAKDFAEDSSNKLSFPMQLFCLKILTTVSLEYFRKDAVVESIRQNLTKVLQSVNAPATPIGLIISSVRCSLSATRRHFLERLLINYLPIKYLANLIFPHVRRLKSMK